MGRESTFFMVMMVYRECVYYMVYRKITLATFGTPARLGTACWDSFDDAWGTALVGSPACVFAATDACGDVCAACSPVPVPVPVPGDACAACSRVPVPAFRVERFVSVS
jgi:hypothetical protein